MASHKLWTIIRAIQRSGEITPRQVRALLGCNSKKACRLLEHLVAVGALKNIGQPRHPVFVLQPSGVQRIKPVPVERQKRSVVEACRQNWQGYQIHKIIGSTRA
ncbi:hypothetical protein [Enterobacter ludwigii]